MQSRIEWRDRTLAENHRVPLFVSVPLIERKGVVYDLRKETPRLFPDLPNRWLLENKVDFLKGDLPELDQDMDGFNTVEEFKAKTDPADKTSHPANINKLRMVERRAQIYSISFAARPDEKTFQLTRYPSSRHPRTRDFSPFGRGKNRRRHSANRIDPTQRKSGSAAPANRPNRPTAPKRNR